MLLLLLMVWSGIGPSNARPQIVCIVPNSLPAALYVYVIVEVS